MLVGTFLLPRDAIALEQTIEELDDVEIEAERIAAHSSDWTMPCLWITGADFDAVDDSLRRDPSVEDVIATDQFEDDKYYHLDWAQFVTKKINQYLDGEGSLLEASADDDGWTVKIRFVTREQFNEFRAYLHDRGYDFELKRLVQPGAPRQSAGTVTPDQREALVTAMEAGYFDVPRATSSRELAEQLDMSHQAVSELLRRGIAALIRTDLVTEADDPPNT
jgi:hypothetical protein